MMRWLLLLMTMLWAAMPADAKSPEKEIAKAMTAGDWLALDSLYSSASKNSISDLYDVLSRCLIGNRFNRPDVSIPAFEKLLTEYSSELSGIQNYAICYSVDLSRVGENAKAASMLSSIIDTYSQQLEPAGIKLMQRLIKKYKCLAKYKPYSVFFDSDTGLIPFRTVPLGNPEKKGLRMRLENSSLNGIDADITFDTGAAMNVISDSLADRFKLIPLDVETNVSGFGAYSGALAIARELKIGNITVNDVPFHIMHITSNNAEADRYLKDVSIIVGSELMLALMDLTIDFAKNEINVTAEAPVKSDIAPNLCFSSEMNLLARGSINGTSLLMNIDTGDCSYGTLGTKFYKRNKKNIKSKGIPTILRRAGIGGTKITKGYELADPILSLGGATVV
ncbi:MAG: retroviral-like aspartic protease family protein, partial [Muribaculaceae bacterium]|nr:retroviral-like aspartic protease family protein [Muribaculaceae bacterium]